MGTFRIYFFGLVCHTSHNDSEIEKDSAVAVDTPGHFRLLRTETKAEPLENLETVRFRFGDNYDPGPARAEPLFIANVPRLRPLMGGRLDRNNLAKLGTIIEYPASRNEDDERRPSSLTVAQFYPYPAQHFGRGKILRRLGCIARLTELTVERPDDTEMDVVVVLRNGSEILVDTVGDGSCVLVSNATRGGAGPLISVLTNNNQGDLDSARENGHGMHAEHAHQDGEHVRHYGSILREENDFVLVAEDDEEECSLDTVHCGCGWLRTLIQALFANYNRTSTHAECGNTSWP
jgi:hypothetical protein